MPTSISPDVEYGLNRLDRLINSSRGSRAATARELSRTLNILHRPLFDFRVTRGNRQLIAPAHRAFHDLMRRSYKAKSTAALRDIMRETRQLVLSVNSLFERTQLETRLHDLEDQIKSTTVSIAEQTEVFDSDVVTLDSLANKRVLFAIMPFHENFSDVWTGGIKRAAVGTGMTPIRIDMITKTSDITDDIVKAIKLAELVVVDVTGSNPNVMFEFGFALALRKPHVVIAQSTELLAFDIKSLRTLSYRNTWQGIETLHKELQPYIRGTTSTKRKRQRKKRANV